MYVVEYSLNIKIFYSMYIQEKKGGEMIRIW